MDEKLVSILKQWKTEQTKNKLAQGNKYFYAFEDADGLICQVNKNQELQGDFKRQKFLCSKNRLIINLCG